MKLIIDTKKLKGNVRRLVSRLDKKVVPTLKAINCDPRIAEQIRLSTDKIDTIAGISTNRLGVLNDMTNTKTMSIRPLRMDQVCSVPDIDIMCMSDIRAIKTLNSYLTANEEEQDIYIMADLGENREGVPLDELPRVIEKVRDFNNINIKGLAANPGCNTGVVHTSRVEELCDISDNLGIAWVSGGSTALLNTDIPDRVDEVRIGEAILTGRHAVESDAINGMSNPFSIEATVIKDRGDSVIYDFGSETTNIQSLYAGPNIIGSWSDMSLVDDPDAQWGETQQWMVNYWGIVRAYESCDVDVVYD